MGTVTGCVYRIGGTAGHGAELELSAEKPWAPMNDYGNILQRLFLKLQLPPDPEIPRSDSKIRKSPQLGSSYGIPRLTRTSGFCKGFCKIPVGEMGIMFPTLFKRHCPHFGQLTLLRLDTQRTPKHIDAGQPLSAGVTGISACILSTEKTA